MDLIEKYLGEAGDYHSNPLDTWLLQNGWKETHGIALYTHPKYPLIGVDTNSGNAAVEVFKTPQKVFNDEGALQDYVENKNTRKLEKAVERGIIVSEMWKAVNGRKGYKSTHLTGPSISLYKDGYGVHIYFDQSKLVMTLSGFNVKREEKVSFPYKTSSIRPIVNQMAKWEKEQWT